MFSTVLLAAALAPAAPPPEKLWGDGAFTEGAAEGPDGRIYFSDIGDRILRFDPATGRTAVFREPSGKSNGLKFDRGGRLLACEGAAAGNRRVSVTENDGTVRALADRWRGRRFNSPNDLTLDAAGRVYFTDPRYGGREPREIDVEAVYRIDADGTVTQVITDLKRPNGLAISPDGKTLYVADNKEGPDGALLLAAYPLAADGSCGPKRVLYDFKAGRGIDGMAVAADGTILATAGTGDKAGVYSFSPAGEKIGFLPTPEDPTNLCLAGKDRKTLYITAGKSLYRTAAPVRDAPRK